MKDYPDAIRANGILILNPIRITSVQYTRKEVGYEASSRLAILYTNAIDKSSWVILLGEQAESWWSDFLARLDIEDDPELMEVVL